MTTAAINDRFDYITVRVTFAPKARVNMTWSRSGMKLSGSADWMPHGKAIIQAMECPKTVKLGEWTKLVAKAGEKAATVADLASQMQAVKQP